MTKPDRIRRDGPVMVRIACLVALLLVAGVQLGLGAEKELSFHEALRAALDGNHEIRALRNVLSASGAEIGMARGRLLPKVGFEERATHTNNPTGVFSAKLNQERFSQTDFAIKDLNNPPATTDFQTLLTIEQPILAMDSFVGFAMAKKEHAAMRKEYDRKREEIVFKVAQTCLRMRTAREQTGVARKGLEDAREHARIAEARYRNEVGNYSEVLRARTATAEAEAQLVSREKELLVEKRWLGFLIGVAEPVAIDGPVVEVPLRSIEQYVGAALSRNDIRALEMRHQAAGDGVRRAQALYLPTVGVGGAYQFNDHETPFGSEGGSWRVAAVLRWDIFDGMNRQFEKMKAVSVAAETADRLTGLKRLASFRIHEAYLAIEEVRKREDLARSALMTAEEGKRLVKARFANSLSPFSDLLDVQLQLDRARAGVVTSEDAYQAAILQLSYESGTILGDLEVD